MKVVLEESTISKDGRRLTDTPGHIDTGARPIRGISAALPAPGPGNLEEAKTLMR